jgi:AraC-like DNA-binding protein
MRTDIHVGVFDVIIFLGVFQGILISWFFIRKASGKLKTNLYHGLLLLSFSAVIFEEWLNNTGFIVRVLTLTNFSESITLAIGPLYYLYLRTCLSSDEGKRVWIHFIPFVFWTFYLVFAFIQPDAVKYNSYIETKHPDWGYLPYSQPITDDPLGLRRYINQLIAIQLIIYVAASVTMLLRRFRSLNESLLRTDNEMLIISRNSAMHLVIIFTLFLVTKLYFGMRSDIGGYFIASYISFMIYAISYQVLSKSDYFNKPASLFPFPSLKYQKSSLSERDKEQILLRITKEMESNKYFTNNLASLSGLSKILNESSHHVSQVINEKLGKNFFDLLAYYRVEHAKKLIREDKNGKITVEELAEIVGYNSKSSFNIAFKKYTSKTPSEYRKMQLEV